MCRCWGRRSAPVSNGSSLAFRDRDALVSCHQELRFTYAELDAAVNEVARGLLARGIEAGDRVGIWSPNNAEWVLTQYATAKIGAHPGDHQSRLSGLRARVRDQPVGLPHAGRLAPFQDERLRGHDRKKFGRGCRVSKSPF